MVDPRPSRVVELRFFGGFSVEETAEALGVSVRTVINDWNTARAWLRHELTTRDAG
jgi:DNA-directed RNA polymerase specialized sigma24 family protein